MPWIRVLKNSFGPMAVTVIFKMSLALNSSFFRINENFLQQLSTLIVYLPS